MGTFELAERFTDEMPPEPAATAALGSEILLHNARWFMKVRWLVVVVFLLAGMVGAIGAKRLRVAGLRIPAEWLLPLAGGLAASNVAFGVTSRRLSEEQHRSEARIHLWLQIAVDVVAITLLVHAIGSEQTFISFVYLFHISLACIFFPKRESILVAVASAALYLAVVVLELSGLWPSAGVFTGRTASVPDPTLSLLVALSAVVIWSVVWYLVSTLSDAVRKRDLRLDRMNEHLVKLDNEKNMQMLLTTHELKVPFASIQSNIDVLKMQYWEAVPEEVRAILGKIDSRAKLLSERISEILYLGNLKSAGVTQPREALVPVELSQLVSGIIMNLEPMVQERRIQFGVGLPPLWVPGSPEHLGVLFTNLLSNAVRYSREGGSVEVEGKVDSEGVHVLVVDHGIGIREDALPHIFEDFYRTKEAARFNRMSSGMGLAIVREIVGQFALRIRVTSEDGTGTTFEVVFPEQKS